LIVTAFILALWFSGLIPTAIQLKANRKIGERVCAENGLEKEFRFLQGEFTDISGTTYVRCEGREFFDNASYYQDVVRYYRID
jgi:hypothetical protein